MSTNIISLIGLKIFPQTHRSVRRYMKNQTKKEVEKFLKSHSEVTYCLTTVDDTVGLWMTAACHKMGIPYVVVCPSYDYINSRPAQQRCKAQYYINRAIKVVTTPVPGSHEVQDLFRMKCYDRAQLGGEYKGIPFIFRNKWMIDNSNRTLFVGCSFYNSVINRFMSEYLIHTFVHEDKKHHTFQFERTELTRNPNMIKGHLEKIDSDSVSERKSSLDEVLIPF